MAPNTHVPAEQLEADIRDGTIDTVVVAFADHHGRLVGERTDAGSRVFLHLLALLSPRK